MMLARGWHWAFFVSAAIGLGVLIVWMVIARDRPDDHPWVGPVEMDYIRAGIPTEPDNSRPMRWRNILRNRQVLLLAVSYFTYGYVAYVFFTWFFTYLSVVRRLDLKSSALYGMLPFIAMAIASPLGGWLADRLTRRVGVRAGRCWTAAGSLGAAAVFVALATQVADARAACLVLAGGAGALYLSQSAYWTLSADIGGRSAGSVSGVMNMFCQIGGTLTASLTPLLAERFGWSISFDVVAIVCLLGGVIWLFIEPTERLTREAVVARDAA
jgi:ACS family glucarate transporter-like MFS transporter